LSNKNIFTSYRNKFKTIKCKVQRQYYIDKFNEFKSNSKQTWNIVRSYIGSGSIHKGIEGIDINSVKVKDLLLIANKFNDYFVNTGETLAANIPKI